MQGVIDPFNSYGTFQMNQGVSTTMSYNDGFPLSPMGGGFSSTFGSQTTPMAFCGARIAAQQHPNRGLGRRSDDV
jgi:serralysin